MYSKHYVTKFGLQDLRLMGMLQEGVYPDRDDCEGVHPETINRYYGVDLEEERRVPGQTGAGHPSDEALDVDECVFHCSTA